MSKIKEVLIVFKDKERSLLKITEPKEANWVKDFFRYVSKENLVHSIHKDNISEVIIQS